MARHELTLSSFLGRWTILREIRDEAGRRAGRLEGQAVFRLSGTQPQTVAYEERGELRMDDAPALSAQRTFIWRQGAAENVADVLFDDGRDFHRIDLNRTMPFATHFCAPDLYEVTYDFREWPVWRTEWRVQGPRKDYRMWSRFRFMGNTESIRTTCAPNAAEAESPAKITEKREEKWRSTHPTGS